MCVGAGCLQTAQTQLNTPFRKSCHNHDSENPGRRGSCLTHSLKQRRQRQHKQASRVQPPACSCTARNNMGASGIAPCPQPARCPGRRSCNDTGTSTWAILQWPRRGTAKNNTRDARARCRKLGQAPGMNCGGPASSGRRGKPQHARVVVQRSPGRAPAMQAFAGASPGAASATVE